MTQRYRYLTLTLLTVFTLFIGAAQAQYFGRNKPLYKRFDYNVYQTPNFEIYNYFRNDSIINRISQTAEKWYWMHYQVFSRFNKGKKPIDYLPKPR